VETQVVVEGAGDLALRQPLVHGDAIELVDFLVGQQGHLGHHLDRRLLLILLEVPELEEGLGVGHGLALSDPVVLFAVAAAVEQSDDVPRIVGFERGHEFVGHAQLLEDRLEGRAAHGYLAVGEEIVGVAIFLDADHLAAEQLVLLDQQAVVAALLQKRGGA
jgi:hypothetical protein